MHEPEVLILDEPTSGLDPNQIAEIRGVIKQIGQEKTVIFSTHILGEVQATCSRVIIISDGKIGRRRHAGRSRRASRRAPSIDPARDRRRARQRHRSARRCSATSTASRTSRRSTPAAGACRIARARRSSASSPRRASTRAATSRASSPPRRGMDLLQMTPEKASLEDVFRKLTTTPGSLTVRNTMAIAKREFGSYVNSPIPYILVTLYIVIAGYLFFSQLFLGRQADMRGFFENMPLFFCFLVPLRDHAPRRRGAARRHARAAPDDAAHRLAGRRRQVPGGARPDGAAAALDAGVPHHRRCARAARQRHRGRRATSALLLLSARSSPSA